MKTAIVAIGCFALIFSKVYSTNTLNLKPLQLEPVETWYLDDLNTEKLQRIKGRGHTIVWNSSHATYKGENCFIKIWDHDRLRSKIFLKAYSLGVFEGTVCLKAVILEKKSGLCRGYATSQTRHLKPTRTKISKHLMFAAREENRDSIAVFKLLERMRQKTIDTGFIFGDFRESNVGVLGNECYFYDLDGVVPAAMLNDITKWYLWVFYRPYLSRIEIAELFNVTLPRRSK